MIRELLAAAKDRERQSVLADWCEENGRLLIAESLRSDKGPTRWLAVQYLQQVLTPRFNAQGLQATLQFLKDAPDAPDAKTWLTSVLRLSRFAGAPEGYLAMAWSTSFGRVRWALARELLSADAYRRAEVYAPKRLIRFPNAVQRPCATCGAPAVCVGHDQSEESAESSESDRIHWTEISTLCLVEPHVTVLGTSARLRKPATV